jgi:hypothetical protein
MRTGNRVQNDLARTDLSMSVGCAVLAIKDNNREAA